MRKTLLMSSVVTIIGACVTPAAAHGDLTATDPESGATIRKVPRVVSATFTETPARGASAMKVRDGCRNRVGTQTTLTERTMEVQIQDARPGSWRVNYRIISAEDGHPSKGSYTFKVAGRKDCNKVSENPPRSRSTPDAPGPGAGAGEGRSSGGTFPFLLVGAGTVFVVIFALLVRRKPRG